MNNLLFIDTWRWLTLHDKKESAHQKTVKFYQKFLASKGRIYTTDYVLDETFTLLFKRLNSYQANSAASI
jgi:predicted nucleic acid-binding protein